MNADMLNRGTEDRTPSLSLSFLGGGGANVPSAPSGSATGLQLDIRSTRTVLRYICDAIIVLVLITSQRELIQIFPAYTIENEEMIQTI